LEIKIHKPGVIKMQVLGNGQSVNIQSRYNLPYTKVWKEGKRKIYWIEIPYEKSLKVMDVVSEAVRNHGKDKNFWNILGNMLKAKFEMLDFESSKEDNQETTNKNDTYKQEPTQKAKKVDEAASYAKVIYSGKLVSVNLYSNDGPNVITFERRKSWSHRKYVDQALEKSGMKPSHDFSYGWEFCS
jgi:hypothetical protein